jgi:hypothetical protein
MNRKRTIATMAALGGLTAAVALLSGLPTAKADELADLRANQELLQRRLDQLAQVTPDKNAGFGGYLGPTSGGPAAVQMMGGSFPRSFLIPGTDTSIRVGGQIQTNVSYWITGGNAHTTPQSGNTGSTGTAASTPLSTNPGAAATGHSVFTIVPSFSRIDVETRTPTAWGEARTFIEFDYSGLIPSSARPTAISDNLTDRLKYAYGTLGGVLAGQANSNFSDSDSGMEVVATSGLTGYAGVARLPQVRYTAPLANWGIPGALSVSAETPETELWSPGSGLTGSDAILNVPPGGTLLYTSSAASNPTKSKAPDLTAAWYIPQPWGHMDFAAVVRPALQIKDGGFVDRTFTGYGAAFSGDVKPHLFGWDKDYIVWSFGAGDAMGRYLASGSGNDTVGLVSNWTGITTSAAGAANIIVKPVREFGGAVGYQHWWTRTLHSNIGWGIYHEDINTLNGVVCNGGGSAAAQAARRAGTAGCNLNKEFANPTANLFWSPVAFVDVAIEYMYVKRQTVGNQTGEQHTVEGLFRVRF